MDRLLGRTLGPYDLQVKLGSGGMGTVYRAVHRILGQPRAVKILSPAFTFDDTFVERFRREATIASGLRHPNIVLIYDIAEQDGVHYIVMDLVHGPSLRDLSAMERPLPVKRAVRILRQLADALDYAHGQGVLHRDVKPANVLVGTDDQVTLVDFGIARAVESTHLTGTGMIVGTPAYMAPEIWKGAGSTVSTDLYALGIVAYELVTGQVPFGGRDTPAIMHDHIYTPPVPPRSHRVDLAESMERALLRQLSKLPAERHPSAGSFVASLVGDEHTAPRERDQRADTAQTTLTEGESSTVQAFPPRPHVPIPPLKVSSPTGGSSRRTSSPLTWKGEKIWPGRTDNRSRMSAVGLGLCTVALQQMFFGYIPASQDSPLEIMALVASVVSVALSVWIFGMAGGLLATVLIVISSAISNALNENRLIPPVPFLIFALLANSILILSAFSVSKKIKSLSSIKAVAVYVSLSSFLLLVFVYFPLDISKYSAVSISRAPSYIIGSTIAYMMVAIPLSLIVLYILLRLVAKSSWIQRR